jgi:hypothetical protein
LFIVGSLVGGDDLFREFVRHVREVRELHGVGGAAFCF